jgi:hypothetical protein
MGQEQKAPDHRNRNSIEWFNADADHHSDKLLLKALQFDAPYPGFYQTLSLDYNGHAFTARIVPDWATQGSGRALLDGALFDQIKQMLAVLSLTSDASLPEPEPGQLHTALVFYDGKAYERHNFNGVLPERVQVILDLIRTELERQAKLQYEEFLTHHKLMEETYGAWQNMSGVAVVTGSRMHGLRDVRGLLLTLTGHRKPILPSDSDEVSIYHILIFYPEGVLTGAGSGGTWSDDPVSSQVVIWNATKAVSGGDAEMDKRTLEIKHQAIDKTVSVGGKTYELADGNLFVIHLSENWTPITSQLGTHFDERTGDQIVLERFKSVLKEDKSIQRLELMN